MKKIKVASFFSGCGGADLGLLGDFHFLNEYYSPLPFEIIYALDFDKHAVQTYNTNFKHHSICMDIKDVEIHNLEDFDCLIGGFPCQSFSTLNPNKDTNDDRANLYKELVKILKIKQPKYFIAENVKGLMTLQKGEILKKVIDEFNIAGYNTTYKLLTASNFGIPQKRERLFIVGVRTDMDVYFEFPNDTHAQNPTCQKKPLVPLKSVINKLAIDDNKYYFSQKAVDGMKNAKNNMKRGLHQDLNSQCLTITSHLAKTSLNSRDPVLLVDANKEIYRRFTPREAAHIQSFPEKFEFPVSETQAYRQIGNAVPPVLMWHIAKELAKLVNNK